MDHSDDGLRQYLDGRVFDGHLESRLKREIPGGEPVIDPDSGSIHIENLPLSRICLEYALRITGLYRRGQRNARRLCVREHDLPVPGLTEAMRGYRLLHVSDPHLDVDPGFAEGLADQLSGLQWDACVITGDFRYRTNGNAEPALTGLETVRSALDGPVYAVLGNHDSIRMVPRVEALGIRVLLNEGLVLGPASNTGVWLAGVDDPHYYRQHDIVRALRARPDRMPAILLAHSPEAYRDAAAAGVSAMLCGHTHGGQIRLPGGFALTTNADCPRALASGAWEWQGMTGYTSVGAGASVLDVRYNCPPEVVLHTLTPN
ncbi:metallophosphoesterase [Aquisalimonas asiatica]|uniref:Calcineurin-like phosphoesterase domain-containing protein n=1 Tax=Aquisalimonas asiatica TaxID=406100 RepID=A0A1H8PR23_9GAMM|nr:metallophosphoesterase [Aquisalimonas asiatica]SEO44167.1 hypothetical protein SAMN04488052_10194 [Aquisalimonas asiatica]